MKIGIIAALVLLVFAPAMGILLAVNELVLQFLGAEHYLLSMVLGGVALPTVYIVRNSLRNLRITTLTWPFAMSLGLLAIVGVPLFGGAFGITEMAASSIPSYVGIVVDFVPFVALTVLGFTIGDDEGPRNAHNAKMDVA